MDCPDPREFIAFLDVKGPEIPEAAKLLMGILSCRYTGLRRNKEEYAAYRL